MVSCSSFCIATPDPVECFRHAAEFNTAAPETRHGGGDQGCNEYPLPDNRSLAQDDAALRRRAAGVPASGDAGGEQRDNLPCRIGLQPLVCSAATETQAMMTGKILLILGLVTALVGAVLLWAPGLLGWFGHLPGDIRIERENGSFFFPVTSMLIVSIVVSIIINLFFRR